jgi:hypothetical protein
MRSPLTGSDADYAAAQASGIEKSGVDGCGSIFPYEATFDREFPTSVRTGETFLQFTSSRTWLLHIAVLVGRCLLTLALILQSHKLTALCCSAVYRLFC